MLKAYFCRWGIFFIGLMVLGLGVTMTIKGQRLGVGSWDVLHIGLFNHFGFTIGTWNIVVGIIIITISSIGLRRFPRVGTFINMISVGLFIDFFNWLLPDPTAFIFQVLCFVLGVMLAGAGSGIYIAAKLGAGPRDSLMLLISQKIKWSIQVSRTIMEVFVVVIGYLLGGPVGVGTVIMAFGTGPVIQMTLRYTERALAFLLREERQVSNF